MKNICTLVIIMQCFCALFINAQNSIDLNSLPAVEDLIVQTSNVNTDTVIIGMHGGPTEMLYPGDFDFFSQVPTYSVVEVQQYQHLNSGILENSAMTLDEGIVYNDTTIAMLQKVILHFTNQGKTVVIMGHSFGAFIMTEYVDDYGMEHVHRVIPMAGRMNINDEFWMAYEAGQGGFFGSNGLTPIIPPEPENEDIWATMKLMAGMGYNRWVDSLATEDLSKFLYVYGEYDEAVGRLLQEETSMIESVNGSVLMVPQGDHGSMFAPFYMNKILDFIRDNQIVKTNDLIFKGVQVYPTIVSDFVHINTTVPGTVFIRNSNGVLMQQFDCFSGNNTFQMSGLSKGFYVATFVNKQGEYFSQKLILK